MKKIIAGLMIAAAMLTFGCGGRNADFGTVDMERIQSEAPVVKQTQEDFTKKMTELKTEMDKELEGKTGDDAKKISDDYAAKAKLVQSEAMNKLKSSQDAALKQVADEKKLGAILDKRAVPQGGTDVTSDVIAKMK